MITAEMKNMILREQAAKDVAIIKKELEALKLELAQIKEILRGQP
jgi:hypothetical protein